VQESCVWMGVEDEERTGVVTLSGRRDDIRLWGGGDVGDRVRSASWGIPCMVRSRKRAKTIGTFGAVFI